MRKLLPILIVLLVAVYFVRNGSCTSSSPSENTPVSPNAQSATTPETDESTSANSSPSTSNNGDQQQTTYAVIVGVSDYLNMKPGNGDLNVPTVDAKRMYDFFRTAGGGSVPEQHMVLLLNDRATKLNITLAMRQLYAKAGPEDRVIFFFAGHGDKGFFLPYEYEGSRNSALFHDEVKAFFKQCSAKTKLCIADACHSGSIKNPNLVSRDQSASVSKADTGSASYRQLEDGGGVVVMMAAKSNEVSWETSEIGQGVFSFFLVRGLGGQADKNQDRVVSIEELYFYVRTNVRQYVYNKCRDANGRPAIQTPICFGRFDRQMPVGYVNQ